MLRLTHLAIAFGTRVLYSGVNLTAAGNERIGLVGENGAGKTSLFRAILGELPLEDGAIEAPERDKIAYVSQIVEATEEKALSYVMGGHIPLVRAKEALAEAEATSDAMALASAHAQLADINEGAVKAQASCVMAGLGFSQEDALRPVREFSGGWRNRLALARALMQPSELLLLDEPTNHLDIDSLIWLEAWLKKVQATILIISHDREFLDRATNVTWAIENETILRYAGSYSDYERQRIEKERLMDANAKAYERKAAHLTAFIERFRYKATKARQAQSRIKMLEKLEAVEPVRAKRAWRFEFLEPRHCPEHLVDLEKATLGYDQTSILSNVTLSIRAGERIGVLGVNGAGKSTLIKTIDGCLPLLAGQRRLGQGTVIGYFAQHQLEQLDETLTPLETLKHKSPETREQELRDYLGRFHFSGERVDELIAPMSGGEKARLALALLAWDKPNLLVLDEPTNHLDMATREALTMALSTFEGALLLVSHDRHLLRTCAERLILVHEGAVTEYEGDLDDYAELVLEHRRLTEKKDASEKTSDTPVINRREERRAQAQERARIAELKKPLLTKLKKVETALAEASASLKALDTQIADTAWYETASPDAVADALKERGTLASRVEALEGTWLEVSEALEKIA
ncbi:MAG: ABC-F family ATP-binding cassette domain-containing protein [Sutterella sp.]|nr:ATP-binding cassette domain-containing protein [Sutterella sp.]MDD7428041.1 ABC-F family ATP-binding cassette domain-containing protein [Sutterella sp.]MDY3273575.1 ABC-F family ATP-binding cassette domain-containing protein [Duodenibacillus sp.]